MPSNIREIEGSFFTPQIWVEKPQVATSTTIHAKLSGGRSIGKASNELFAQFFYRIYTELSGCILASFSTTKYLNATNFIKFREFFQASFLGGFVCPSFTFDNVNGHFPISFIIWDLAKKEKIITTTLDVYEPSRQAKLEWKKNVKIIQRPAKSFYANTGTNIKDWLRAFNNTIKNEPKLAHLVRGNADMQSNRMIFITLTPSQAIIDASNESGIYKSNLIVNCIFFAVRKCIKETWLNDRDQFLAPRPSWVGDREFHFDCLAFALFHGKNRSSSFEGTNHFIPFAADELGAQGDFDSNFMSEFLAGKLAAGQGPDLIASATKRPSEQLIAPDTLEGRELLASLIPDAPVKFSPAAAAPLRG